MSRLCNGLAGMYQVLIGQYSLQVAISSDSSGLQNTE